MNVEARIEKSKNCKDKGYTCCQTVIMGVADLLEIKDTDIFKCAEGFGGGVGGLGEVCGVVSAMTMVAGLINGSGDLENNTSKMDTIELVEKLALEFKEKHGSLLCRDIRNEDAGSTHEECDKCIQDGIATLIEKFFPEKM